MFSEWQETCPRATELAEVFALGRTMWMNLSQTKDDFEEAEHPDDVQISWPPSSDIPTPWISMVTRCMNKDPNNRPNAIDVVNFWDQEVEEQERVSPQDTCQSDDGEE